MERSRLPLLSLLGLFGAHLMLSLELPMGIAGRLSDVSVLDPGVHKALAFALQQYNHRMPRSPNYFTVLNVLKVQTQVETRNEYHFTVRLGETTCPKSTTQEMDFETIQMCQLRTLKVRTCYFKVIISSPAGKMKLGVTRCS